MKIICHSFLDVHNSVGEGEQEGTTNFTFFRKLRKHTLWWVQNLNLRNIYLIGFLRCFCVFGFKVQKSTNMTKFFLKIKKGIKKRRITCWFQIREKGFLKMHQKVISKTSLMNMSKSGKSAYFHHIYPNNFFNIF